MIKFSLRRLNWCAVTVSATMLLLIPLLVACGISWPAYILLAAGAILYLILFFAYQRKVSDFLMQ